MGPRLQWKRVQWHYRWIGHANDNLKTIGDPIQEFIDARQTGAHLIMYSWTATCWQNDSNSLFPKFMVSAYPICIHVYAAE